jgi:tetratricopeptide (TPR) repeat protein
MLGLFSKEGMAIAIVIAPFFDRAFIAGNWRQVRQRWWVYAACIPSILFLMSIVAYQSATQDEVHVGFGISGVTAWEYFRSQPSVILHYLRLTFWPDVLCIDYKWPIVNDWPTIATTGSLCIAMFVGSIVAFVKAPKIGFLGLTFFLVLAPTSSFMPLADLAFEHRMYLPLAAVLSLALLAAFYGLSALPMSVPSKRRLATVALAAIILSLSIRTWQRNHDYADPNILWSKVIEVAPHNYRAYYNLGVHYMRAKNTDKAISMLKKAIELRPRYVDARYNLALQYDRQGQLVEAAKQYEVLVKLNPKDASVWFNLGGIAHRQDDWDLAASHYLKTLELAPEHIKARLQCARVFDAANKRELANEHLSIALEYGKQQAWVLDAIGNTYANRDDYVRAIEMYDLAMKLDPNFLPAVIHKSRSLYELGQIAATIELLNQTLTKHRNTNINLLLAEILAKASPDEFRDGSRSLKLLEPYLEDSNRLNASILSTSAAAHAELGHFKAAEKRVQMAIELAKRKGSKPLESELERQLALYRDQREFERAP